ncbi:hypothetical protein [Paraburkholderia fungorum]
MRAELIQLEKVGCHSGDGRNTTYPADIQVLKPRLPRRTMP